MIGRNDPCPCGSGKKYKKCHGAKVPDDRERSYERIRRLDGESAGVLMQFAKRRFGETALRRAWDVFHFSDHTPFDLSGPGADTFERWFEFNWRPEGKETLAELLLAEKGSRLAGDLRAFVEATLHSPYSFYQAIAVDPGEGVTMRDILRRREVGVKERLASTIIERGHILLARVVEMDGLLFFMGTGSEIILPGYLDWILDLRAFLESKGPLEDGCITTKTLLDHEEDLREAYFEIGEDQANPRQEIRNTDGDPLAFHTLTYHIPSFRKAFGALKDLQQKITGETDEDLLDQAEKDAAGEPIESILHWLKSNKKSVALGENVTVATLTISASALVVEVNSDKRSRGVQREIAKRLGSDAVLLKTEVKSHAGVMKELSETDEKGAEFKAEHDRLLKESPEARIAMKQMMERHWVSWPDAPLPALRGMTPRRAAKDPEGRELLESLLMEFELRNRSEEDVFLRVDTDRLRRELGLKPDIKKPSSG